MTIGIQRDRLAATRKRAYRPHQVPKIMLCEASKRGKVVGRVVASTDLDLLPFRRSPGAAVRALAAVGGSPADLKNLLWRSSRGYYRPH